MCVSVCIKQFLFVNFKLLTLTLNTQGGGSTQIIDFLNKTSAKQLRNINILDFHENRSKIEKGTCQIGPF